ncbi:CHASE domain-containing protein [Azospirillum canadense]|uniref:CHASE domain-containing protein n=1 Tax=Azospirillum canadense TaxID=403962 RepID=UPI00222632D1|nr:CHASE domain-containing protein [Azospirillum canadense]MCW2235973.1 signal transduction histidine kinase [Azospirillum canadense]
MIPTPPGDRPHDRPQGRPLRSWESWVVFGLSLLLTGLAWWLLSDQNDRLAHARFQARAGDLTSDVASRLGAYEQMLHGGVAMMNAAGGRASREEWRTYVSGLHVEDRYPGIQGIGYAKRVVAADLEMHEAIIRAEGFYSYDVTPHGVRPEYFPVVYIEPFASRNLRAFGYDMHSEPMRRATMERARDTGSPSATGKLRLVQETDSDVQPGFLIYLPVYDQRRPLATAADRHAALLGFVYSPFRMHDLMRAILKPGSADDLDLQLYDGTSTEPDALLFEKSSIHHPRFQESRHIDVFGRRWTLRIASAPAFEAGIDHATPRAVLVAGVIIALLLVTVVNSVLQDRNRMAELRRSYHALARARAEAEEANAAKSRFLAAASHDLRQPLQTLGIYLHMIGERADTPTAVKLVDSARDAFEATQRMLNSLMDIAMLETGVIRPQLTEIDLPAFLARISEDIRMEAADKGLAFRVVSCNVRVTTDPSMLERIVRNLLSNALKYTRTGTIRLACRVGAEFVAIKVQDTGPGIPQDRMHLIFEDFYQIGNPERDRRKGLGLGLATVARLTRLLGYRLRVLSRPGRGAIFMVEVPRDARPTAAKEAKADEGGEAGLQPSPASSARSASNSSTM